MLTRRIIVCLDVQGGRVVKGVQFESLRDVGDPVVLAERYEREGADEVVYLDISASAEARSTLWEVAQRTAERLFIPLTIGGGIRSADDVGRALRAGADKVSLNTAVVQRPATLTEVAERFGSQCVVASIDARCERAVEGAEAAEAVEGAARRRWRVYTHGGQRPTALDAVEWAQECVRWGAGEILLTSIDRDGQRSGYDLELTYAVASTVNVPVIASGGAGTTEHIRSALCAGRADAALLAGTLHDGATTIGEIKRQLRQYGVSVRPVK
jgi:cyclase